MDTFDSLMFGIFNTSGNEDRVAHHIVEDYEIDTCYTVDQGYETAIWKGNGTIVVTQRYASRDEAVEGHELWIEYCKLNPVAAYSPQTDRIEML